MSSSRHRHTHTYCNNSFYYHHELSKHVFLPNDSLPSGLYIGRHKLGDSVCLMHVHCNLSTPPLSYVPPWVHGHHISRPSQCAVLNMWLRSHLNPSSDCV